MNSTNVASVDSHFVISDFWQCLFFTPLKCADYDMINLYRVQNGQLLLLLF